MYCDGSKNEGLYINISVFLKSDQAKEIMSDYNPSILENSAKMVLLFHLIEESVRKGDKLLVFRYKIRQDKNTLCFLFLI